jgi:hypothetical protein
MTEYATTKDRKPLSAAKDRGAQTDKQQTHGGSGLKAALHPNARLDKG